MILISYLDPKKSTFRLFVPEKSQVSSSTSSLGIITTEQTTDISEAFMRVFSTSPTTTFSEAELKIKSTKTTRDFSRNVSIRKMRKLISQANLAKTKVTSHLPKKVFMKIFSTAPRTSGRKAELVTDKATTGFPTNNLVRKVTSSSKTISSQSTAKLATTKATTDTPITLFVRMAGKLPDHRHRYLCDLFRTTVLFWPSSYGTIVTVLDDEARDPEDHEFGDKAISETKKYFPDRKLEVLHEGPPKHRNTLDFPASLKSLGYNRQLWSSFFIDLYSNDSVIAWIDADDAFFTPVTKSSIFNGTKLQVLGTGCTFQLRSWVYTWALKDYRIGPGAAICR